MIVLYKIKTCPYCQMVKEYLGKIGAKFQEVDISKDEDSANKMVEKSGQLGVPVLDINGKIVIGFDKKTILCLIKKSNLK